MVLGTLLLLFFTFLESPLAKFHFGRCPTPPRVQNFQLPRYLGNWYEGARDASTPFEKGECVNAYYEMNASNTVRVVNSEYRADNRWHSAEGQAYCEGTDGQCHVRFSKFAPYGDYQVLDTDYDNYAIVYSCLNLYLARWDLGWVLVRDPRFDINHQIETLGQLTGITREQLHITKHDECPPRDSNLVNRSGGKNQEDYIRLGNSL